jgi:hypothetical protein
MLLTNRLSLLAIFGQQQAEEKSGNEAPEMGRHTDARRDEVEGQLQKNDNNDVSQTLPGEGSVTVAKKNAGPRSNHTHDATRGTDELYRLQQSKFR